MYFESKGPGAIRGLTFEDALAFVRRTLNGMKYRDVEYSIVQGVERGKWMWSLSLDTNESRNSLIRSRLKLVGVGRGIWHGVLRHGWFRVD